MEEFGYSGVNLNDEIFSDMQNSTNFNESNLRFSPSRMSTPHQITKIVNENTSETNFYCSSSTVTPRVNTDVEETSIIMPLIGENKIKSVDFLYSTPRRNSHRVKRRVKPARTRDVNDNVLLDLVNESRTLYEKRKKKRNFQKISSNFESSMSPIINSQTHKTLKYDLTDEESVKRINTDNGDGEFDHGRCLSPSITSQEVKRVKRNSSDDDFDTLNKMCLGIFEIPKSPTINSYSQKVVCNDEIDESDAPLSPVITSGNFFEADLDLCDSDEDGFSVFEYPSNTQISRENVTRLQKSYDIKISSYVELNTPKVKKMDAFNTENIPSDRTKDEGQIDDLNQKRISFGNSNVGFLTGKGKEIHVSEERLKKGKKMFEDDGTIILDELKEKAQTGFSTAGGREIKVTEKNLVKSKKLFEDCNLNSPNIDVNISVERNDTKIGFSTALGKNISIGKESLKKVRNLFDEIDCDKSQNLSLEMEPKRIENELNSVKKNSFSFGFATALGKNINIREESLTKAKKLFDEVDYDESKNGVSETGPKEMENVFNSNVKNSLGFGFTTALGKNINIREESLTKAKKLFDEIDCDESKNGVSETGPKEMENVLNSNVKKSLGFGFTTALGKNVNIREESLTKAKKLFDEIDCDESKSGISEIGSKEMENVFNSDVKNSLNFGFKTALGKNINIREQSVIKARKCFEEINSEKCVNMDLQEKCVNMDLQEKSDFSSIAENVIDEIKSIISVKESENNNVKRHCEIESLENDNFDSKIDQNYSFEIKECVAAFLANEDKEFEEFTLIQLDKRNKIHPKREAARRVQNDKINEMIGKHDTSVTEKLKKSIAPMLGKLSLQKIKFKKERVKLSKFVNGRLPKTYTKTQLLEFGIKPSVLSISSSNAESYRFPAREFLPSYNENESIHFEIDDEYAVILDDDGFVGKEEIYKSFVLHGGVNSRLISEKWLFNHYRWIIWKLASMEVAFPVEFAGRCLTLEQVLLQLKFRYDEEIDLCKRSALRKIIEHDDISAKMLILCISDISWKKSGCDNDNDSVLTVEVTDGWYKIPLLVDKVIHNLIEKGKMYVGQKIITQNAELSGSTEPCQPLEISSELRLKLALNSTRPAHWDSKLGFCYNQRFLPISVSSVNIDGGIISCINAVIARIYPVQYMECLDKSYIFRNEKNEDKAAAFHNKIRSNLQEKLMDNLLRTMKVLDENIENVFVSTNSAILDDETGREIYDMLKGKNSELFVTASQKNRLIEYRTKLLDAQKEKFEKKVLDTIEEEKEEGRFPQDRVVIPFQRILIAGISEEDIKNKSTAVLTIWRPPEDTQSFKEGQAMRFYWVTTSKNKMQMKNISLSSTKLTRYKTIKSAVNLDLFKPRKAYIFSELNNPILTSFPYDEVDIVGFVINVQTRGSPCLVFLIDESKDVIGIRFWAGSLVNEDCIVVNKFIAASNLQRRSSSNLGPIPYLDATDSSVFTQVPKCVHLSEVMVKFQTNVKDLAKLTKLGLEKIKTY